MTALTEFERLEAQGIWRATPRAEPREVIVSVGEATLIIFDPATEEPLSHWSLPAVARLNDGELPAIYTPRPEEPDETLVIDDPLMLEAIERVHRAIETHRAHPGRLRGVATLIAAALMLMGLIFWLPDALVRYAARVAPPAQTRAIGEAVLAELSSLTGQVCVRASGQAVLDWLGPRLVGDGAALRMVPRLNSARRLPGNLYVLGADLVEAAAGPEAAAGHLLVASQTQSDAEVTLHALEYAGAQAALKLLTLGRLPENALAGYSGQLLTSAPARPDDQVLMELFNRTDLPITPYARSVDPTGETVLELIEADPYRTTPPQKPLLTPPQWQAMQQICAG